MKLSADSWLYPARQRLKNLVFSTGLVKTNYDLSLDPQQFLELMLALQRGEFLEGDVIEVGVARGKTTLFLNRFMDYLRSSKRYFAVDTFRGFEQSDVAFEKNQRAKERFHYVEFSFNSPDLWKRTVIEHNHLERVVMVTSDIKRVTFQPGQLFSTALVDVDLYQPTKAALDKIYPLVVEGGTIVVDDVSDRGGPYDGAYSAFMDFVEATGAEHRIVQPKCGIIAR